LALKVLAVDTSHEHGSAALAVDGRVEVRWLLSPRSHLRDLPRVVRELLDGFGLGPGDLDRLALTIGPGSFTGLRVALAFAKGLAAARGTPVVAVGTLELLALPWVGERPVAVAVDARKGEVYGAVFERADLRGEDPWPLAARIPPGAFSPEAFRDRLPPEGGVLVGTGAVRYRDLFERTGWRLEPEGTWPDTARLARLARRVRPVPATELLRLEPTYIRPSDAVLRRLRQVSADGSDPDTPDGTR
jgi:tRNA threonylcarbamoyladenosine biosynthesis protein TsaB